MNRSLRTFLITLATFMGGLFCYALPTFAAPQINNQINYQARLMDASGFPVADGTYSIKFSLYDAATAGTRLWSASGTTATPIGVSVSVQNGLFSILLGDTSLAGGSQNTFDTVDWNSDQLFLGVTIAADAEMSPRKRFASAPQAFNSRQLQGMYASSTASGGQNLFTINQTAADAATGTRSALLVRSNGTSSANDFLIRGINDTGSLVFSVNRQGNATTSFLNASSIFASMVTSTNLQVNIASFATATIAGQGVCLSNGSFCASGVTGSNTDLNWTFSLAGDFVRNATATTDIAIGSSTLANAPFVFLNNTTTSRFLIGQNSSTGAGGDLVIGATTSSGMNTLFQLSGDDLFVAGNIGSASSVFTNGEFIAGPGSTHYGDGLISKNDGVLTIQSSSHLVISPGAAGKLFLDSTTVNIGSTTVAGAIINFNGYISTDYIPSIGNLYDLGAGATTVRNIYASGTIRAVSGVYSNLFATNASATSFIATSGTITTLSSGTANISTLNVSGNATVNGDTLLGDNSGVDRVIFTSTIDSDIMPTSNNTYSLGQIGQAWKGYFSSVTTTNLNVNGQNVCLANGTNCSTSATGTDMNWAFNLAGDFVRNATGTTDIAIGSSTLANAPFVFLNNTTTSRFLIGQNPSIGAGADLVIGATTSSGMNDQFQFSGDDLFVAGNIGSASSVYTNGEFVAGPGSTHFGNGYVRQEEGTLLISSKSVVTQPNINIIGGDGSSVAGGNINITAGNAAVATPGGNIILTPGDSTFGNPGSVFINPSGTVNQPRLRFTSIGDGVISLEAPYTSSTVNFVLPFGDGASSTVLGTNGSGALSFVSVCLANGTNCPGSTVSLNSSSLSLVASSTTLGSSNLRVVVDGKTVYVSSNASSSLSVFEHTASEILTFVTTTHLTNAPNKMQVVDGKLYILTSTGFDIYDITDHAHPVLDLTIPISGIVDFKVVGGFIYSTFITGDTLRVINAANGTIGSVTGTESLNAIDVVGNVLVVGALSTNNVYIYDVSNPFIPKELSIYNAGAVPSKIQIYGNYAYIGRASITTGRTIDLNNLTVPTTKGTFSCAFVACNPLLVAGRYLYSAGMAGISDPNGLRVTDNRDPANPVAVAFLEYGKNTNDFAISGQYLYATVADAGAVTSSLYVVDVSGTEVNGLTAHSAQIGNLQTLGPAIFDDQVNIKGGLNLGLGGLMSEGIVNIRASSTSATVSIINTGTTNPAGTNWAAYIKNLLVGTNANASGTQNYSMVLAYASSSSVGGLCIDDTNTTSTCPSGSSGLINGASLLADGAVVANAFDIAEIYDTTGTVSAGDVLVLDASSTATVKQSVGIAYDSKVIGVVSTDPGFQLGWGGGSRVALAGRVPVKVSMNNGAIHIGDALVSSDVAGYAMKATQPGMVLGYALEDASATGTAQIFVNVSFWAGLAIGPGGSIQLDESGNVSVLHDLHVGGKLFPSLKGGGLQSDWYLFVDDTDATSTYISTNADGFQSLDTYDFAERYYSPDELDSGDLVIVSDTGKTHVQRSMNAEQMLLGIVSTRPAFIAGRPATSTYPIALSGRVPTKVSTMNGAIKAGDPIGPTTIPGVAAKAIHTGPIVGLALEDFDGAEIAKIEVFVNPGWWTNVAETNQQTVINNNTVVNNAAAPIAITHRGVGKIATGSKRVHVNYASIGAYPFVQVTPRGLIQGNWGTDGYSDTGFDIILSQEQTFDAYFSWQVEPLQGNDRLNVSDGTSADLDPVTGLPTGYVEPTVTETIDNETISNDSVSSSTQ